MTSLFAFPMLRVEEGPESSETGKGFVTSQGWCHGLPTPVTASPLRKLQSSPSLRSEPKAQRLRQKAQLSV